MFSVHNLTGEFVEGRALHIMKKLTSTSFWDKQWSDRAADNRLGGFLRQRDHGAEGVFLRAMAANVPDIWRGAKVCELGGGASEFLVDLALHKQAQVCAIDYSPKAIEITRQRYDDLGILADVIEADIFKLDAYNGQYDVVIHWGLLEHFSDPAPVLKVSRDLLRPGGHLIFSMPNMAAAGARLWKRHAPENFSAHIYHADAAVDAAAVSVGLEPQHNFWFGPPLFRMAPPESRSVTSLAADVAHAGALLVGTVFPGLYATGKSNVAANRGFYMTRSDAE